MLGFQVRLGLEFRVRLWPVYIYRLVIHDQPHLPPVRLIQYVVPSLVPKQHYTFLKQMRMIQF